VAAEWDTWQLCASVYAKQEVGISLHLLCGSLSVNVYLSVCPFHDGWESAAACASICLFLEKTGAEMYGMLQTAFGESCLIEDI
jgi:hypothetical protein